MKTTSALKLTAIRYASNEATFNHTPLCPCLGGRVITSIHGTGIPHHRACIGLLMLCGALLWPTIGPGQSANSPHGHVVLTNVTSKANSPESSNVGAAVDSADRTTKGEKNWTGPANGDHVLAGTDSMLVSAAHLASVYLLMNQMFQLPTQASASQPAEIVTPGNASLERSTNTVTTFREGTGQMKVNNTSVAIAETIPAMLTGSNKTLNATMSVPAPPSGLRIVGSN